MTTLKAKKVPLLCLIIKLLSTSHLAENQLQFERQGISYILTILWRKRYFSIF